MGTDQGRGETRGGVRPGGRVRPGVGTDQGWGQTRGGDRPGGRVRPGEG